MAKMIKVSALKNSINDLLKNSNLNQAGRQALITVLEPVLNKTKNYNGFRYLRSDELDAGQLPGINMTEDYRLLETTDKMFAETDSTRVHYF